MTIKKFFSPLWASLTCAIAGASTWWFIAAVTHKREAWDDPRYFTVAFPVMAIIASVIAFVHPQKAWRWAMIPFAVQALAAFLKNPMANLMPLGLVMFGVLGAFCTIPTTVVAWIRMRFFPPR